MLSADAVLLEGPQEAGGGEVANEDAKDNSFTRSCYIFIVLLTVKVSKAVFECVRPPTPSESTDDSDYGLVDLHFCGMV